MVKPRDIDGNGEKEEEEEEDLFPLGICAGGVTSVLYGPVFQVPDVTGSVRALPGVVSVFWDWYETKLDV